jgi:alpha-L-rhamnosidase
MKFWQNCQRKLSSNYHTFPQVAVFFRSTFDQQAMTKFITLNAAKPAALIISMLVHFAAWSQHTTDLRVEYLTAPLGVDVPTPRFTWRLNDLSNDLRNGASQRDYRILVDIDSTQLIGQNGNQWNTGWVSNGQTLITYSGKALQPSTKYYWRLDVNGQTEKPSITSFETGLMSMSNWKGSWISDNNDIELKPAPYFRKEFSTTKKIKSARAYIAVAGLYELYINGHKIGNHSLDPMYTRFDRRTLYLTHNVTREMIAGKNAIGILLGNGWYNLQSTAVWDFHNAAWRARPTFCLDLRITYEDGSVETVSSDKDWKTELSPLTFNSIYTAEHYDARKEIIGWNLASFDDRLWKETIFRPSPSNNIVSQLMHPVRQVEEVRPVSMRQFNDTTYLFDLGRNISGISKITVEGPAGTTLRLKHSERLYVNGRVDMSNIDIHYRPADKSDPFQTDIFILKGKGEETFAPRFNYKGFQYVEVTSTVPVVLTKENLTAYFMHSDVPVAGRINTSNVMLNRLWWATNNSYLSNLFGYPTDCPQREKNGWTGDSHIALETGLYNFDGITVYEKWLADHRDEQQPNGVLPAIIPTSGWGYHWANGPDWTSSLAIIPWNIYLFYGDSKLLADTYDNIKRYVDHITEISPTGLTHWGLGDWIPVKSQAPVELSSTCYYYADVLILANAAQLFHKEEDHKKYSSLALRIKDAFNQKYLNKKLGSYDTGLQTDLSMPLYWGLVPDEFKSKVAANLSKRVESDNFHLDVGLLGQKAILNALSENGYADVAFKIAAQETYPSWGWWIKNGATTLYEHWNIKTSNDAISMNHIMFGEIGAWMYKGIGGIFPDPKSPGFKNILLKPQFVTGLEHFEAEHSGPQGLITTSWKRIENGISYSVTVPPNSSATLYLPAVQNKKAYRDNGVVHEPTIKLEAGIHSFEWK